MKHAYLILAHGEYQLLSLLVEALDDARNDLYIHIDRKAESLPQLKTRYATLTILEERLDVRWADVSIVEAEFALFRAAYESGQRVGGYAYYHLLSGVDLPIKTQDYIHRFFEENAGKEFIGFYSGANLTADLERKVQLRHLFAKDFRGSGLLWRCKSFVRALFIRIQLTLGMRRYPQMHFAKGTQWLSISEALVYELIQSEQSILSLYGDTFCSDEIAIHTFVANSPFMSRVYKPQDEVGSCMRHIGWHQGHLLDFGAGDLESLQQSEALFARKFNSRDMDFVHNVLKLSTPHKDER